MGVGRSPRCGGAEVPVLPVLPVYTITEFPFRYVSELKGQVELGVLDVCIYAYPPVQVCRCRCRINISSKWSTGPPVENRGCELPKLPDVAQVRNNR